MKKFLRTNLPKVWQINVLLFLLFPAFPLIYGALLLALLFLVSLAYAGFVQKPDFKNVGWPLKLLLAYFLLLIVFLPQSNHIDDAFFDVQKKLGMILLPLSFVLASAELTETFKKKMLTFYSWSSALFALYIVSRILIFGVNHAYLPAGLSVAMRTTIQDFTGVHPTYLAMVLGMGFLILLYQLKSYAWKSSPFWLSIAAMGIIGFCLLTLGARMPLIALVFASAIILYGQYKKRGLQLWGGLMILLLVGVLANPITRYRAIELVLSAVDNSEEFSQTTTNVRSAIYSCSLEQIKAHWAFGLGAGDIQEKLDECYVTYENDELNRRSFNTHNEYFNVWLSTGIFGLLVFLSMIFMAVKNSRNKVIPLAFLVLILFCFISENVLSHQTGVFLFGLFFGLFFTPSPNSSALHQTTAKS